MGELEDIRTDVPTVYMGEASRSIYGRSREHCERATKGSVKDHMVILQNSRVHQIAKAMMIRRRGSNPQLPRRI